MAKDQSLSKVFPYMNICLYTWKQYKFTLNISWNHRILELDKILLYPHTKTKNSVRSFCLLSYNCLTFLFIVFKGVKKREWYHTMVRHLQFMCCKIQLQLVVSKLRNIFDLLGFVFLCVCGFFSMYTFQRIFSL